MVNKLLTLDLAQHNCSSVALHPGYVATDMNGEEHLLSFHGSLMSGRSEAVGVRQMMSRHVLGAAWVENAGRGSRSWFVT
jgi:NAD(P)-dependent dehydrogenase (short-subunit alcohol dehydrogenase family)